MIYRVIVFLSLLILGNVGAGMFLPGTEDVPLMEGIVLTETTDFSFDTPEGQILMIEGKMKKNSSEVRAFYDETLSSLGWQKEKQDFYRRGNDVLRLSFEKNNIVRFDALLKNDF